MDSDVRVEIDVWIDDANAEQLDEKLRLINLNLTKLLDDDVIDDFDITNVDSV